MKAHLFNFNWTSLLWLAVLSFSIVACGGAPAGQAPAGPAATDRPIPTMPPARFTAVAQQVYTDTNSAGSEAQAVPTDAPNLDRGATVYTNRCASCHGDQGEGVAGEGEALAGKVTTLAAFNDLLRTGGQGELGPEHLFGPNAISPSGMDALYAYVQSISQ